MSWRRLFPRQPAVTEENRRRVWKTQQRRHRLDVMLPVNEIGRGCNCVEVVDDGDRRLAKLACSVAQLRTVNDGAVAAAKQVRRQLTDVKLRPRAAAQEVIGDQNAEPTQRSSLFAFARIACARGNMCSS